MTNHYQVITICNTLPSILKCQNRQHFLILHRAIYGISDAKQQNICAPKVTCMQIDEKDEFNCTGSNICVFYPTDRYLRICNRVKSNLTQIHITCVNLGHLKKYYLEKNRKFDQKAFDNKLKEANALTNTLKNQQNINLGNNNNINNNNENLNEYKNPIVLSILNATNISGNVISKLDNRLRPMILDESNSSKTYLISLIILLVD